VIRRLAFPVQAGRLDHGWYAHRLEKDVSSTPQVDYEAVTVATAEALGFTSGFTTHPDFARPAEPALERSRFVVLASVPAAELAHRMANAWPRDEGRR
jgi:hypothetical protein